VVELLKPKKQEKERENESQIRKENCERMRNESECEDTLPIERDKR
jgi:hypothetical protein